MSKILPFEVNPFFCYRQSKGALFGILQAYEFTKSWIFCTILNCGSGDLDMQDDEWLVNCGAILRYKLKSYKICAFFEGTVSRVKKNINNGYYTYLLIDEYYISEKAAYRKYHFVHDLLVYGYDDEKRNIFTVGYNNCGKYKPYTITYEELNKAAKSAVLLDRNAVMYRIKINGNYPFEYHHIEFCDALYKYLKQAAFLDTEPQNGYNGICSWIALREHITDVYNEKTELDLIMCRFIYEHRKYIYNQMIFVNKISSNKIANYVDDMKEYNDRVCRLFYKFIKYTVSNDKQILLNAKDEIYMLYKMEYNILYGIFTSFLADDKFLYNSGKH